MKKNNKRKLRKVTHRPGWILKLNGKRDAKLGGKKAVDMKINEWVQRLATFENDVFTAEEEKMFPLRNEAAQSIYTLMHSSKNAPPADSTYPKPVDTSDPKVIRAARRASSAAASYRSSISNSINTSNKDIIHYNEAIISSNVDVNEHIDRLRNHCNMCISRYLSGVLKVIPDYSFDEKIITSRAKDISSDGHRQLDEEIRRIAYRMLKPEENHKEAI